MTDLRSASARAAEIRGLYRQLEIAHEGGTWSPKDDVLGLVNDVGALARLVMAVDGQWVPDGDVDSQLAGKLAESLWWILSLAERLDVDIDAAYRDTMERIETELRGSIERLSAPERG